MNAIEVHELTRNFNGICAVDQLTFSVQPGTIFGFLGPNGAGKTTTIRLLLGLLEPSSGKAHVMGYDTMKQATEVRAHTGALLEHSGLYEQMSAEDNLEFYGRVYRLTSDKRKKRIRELLETIDLWERRKDQVKKWSRGMKQKLALARTLLHSPLLVLLDEPTAGLDVAAAVEMRARLAELANQQGVTVFLTTHNMTEAEKLCNQVALIRKGRLVARGHPDELRSRLGTRCMQIIGRGLDGAALAMLRARPEVSRAETRNGHLLIDLRAQADPAALVSLLIGAGMQVDEVRRENSSLEDVYLTLMGEEK